MTSIQAIFNIGTKLLRTVTFTSQLYDINKMKNKYIYTEVRVKESFTKHWSRSLVIKEQRTIVG